MNTRHTCVGTHNQTRTKRRNTCHARTLHHLEKNFDDLLQDGQQATVMNTHTAFQQRQDGLHLGKNVNSDKFVGIIRAWLACTTLYSSKNCTRSRDGARTTGCPSLMGAMVSTLLYYFVQEKAYNGWTQPSHVHPKSKNQQCPATERSKLPVAVVDLHPPKTP